MPTAAITAAGSCEHHHIGSNDHAMAMNETGAGGALSIAGILTATPMGLPMSAIAIGSSFAVLGVVGRAAIEWQKYAENQGTMKVSQILAWLGGGIVGAPTMAVLYLALLKSLSVQSDGAAVFGLIFLGWTGPSGAAWLLGMIRSSLASKLGGNALPPAGGKP